MKNKIKKTEVDASLFSKSIDGSPEVFGIKLTIEGEMEQSFFLDTVEVDITPDQALKLSRCLTRLVEHVLPEFEQLSREGKL